MKKLIIVIFILCSCGNEYITNNYSQPNDGGTTSVQKSLPRNLSWANIDTDGDGVPEDYVTSIKRQPCSDCYLYAATGLLEIQFQIDHKTSSTLNLSEQSIHNCLRIRCDGSGDQVWMLDYFKQYGIMEEEYMPAGLWWGCPNCTGYVLSGITLIPISSIPFYTFKDYKEIVSPEMPYADRKMMMVKALQTGPLVMDVSSWDGWGNDNGTLYCKGENLSGHSIIIIGYEEYGDAFLVKNSHGEGAIIRMIFNGGYDCGFAHRVHQIVPGSTYVSYGLGEKFCFSMSDTDGDKIPDPHDNCPYDPNPDQKNYDKDMLGDVCDPCPKDFNLFTGYYCMPESTTATVSKIAIDLNNITKK